MRSVDDITAAELLDGLPSRVHEVYAPFVRGIPDHPAFVEGGRSWSYRQFSEAVDAAAKDLSDLGIRPGDRVMIASENSVALGAMALVTVVLTFLIGVSRIYLGVHWPTDVLAGWCVGAAWALLCWRIALALQRSGRIESDV